MEQKSGVICSGLRPEILYALMLIEPVLDSYGQPLVITELTGGEHSETSRHYIGCAVDLRTWEIQDIKEEVAKHLREVLGAEFVVVVHDTHLHIQFNGVGR